MFNQSINIRMRSVLCCKHYQSVRPLSVRMYVRFICPTFSHCLHNFTTSRHTCLTICMCREEDGDEITILFDCRNAGLKNMDMEFMQFIIGTFRPLRGTLNGSVTYLWTLMSVGWLTSWWVGCSIVRSVQSCQKPWKLHFHSPIGALAFWKLLDIKY